MDRSCTRRLCPIEEGMPCSMYWYRICLKPISRTEAVACGSSDKLEQDLTDAGFDREDIYNALLCWKLADYQEGLAEPMHRV